AKDEGSIFTIFLPRVANNASTSEEDDEESDDNNDNNAKELENKTVVPDAADEIDHAERE
ncbi:hypothetical protein MNBD_GAMMA19-1758, partial [hydrothermal vent metagenome]